MADKPQRADAQDDKTISAADLMAMTSEERAALGFRTVRDPHNLPADVLDRIEAWMEEVAKKDAERPSRRYAS